MATFGDLFPENLKNEVVSENLKIGSVFRTYEYTTNPPKTKRFIIVAVSYDKVLFATVYINTDVNPNLFSTKELKDLHLPLAKESRDYLDWDSHVDCSDVLEKNINDLKATYTNDMGCHLGDISIDDLKKIRKIIKETRTISPAKKKKYGLFL